jgi:hypothetical protein
MVYTAPYLMFLMHAGNEGKWEGVWSLEIETFLGPVKWHGAKKSRDTKLFRNQHETVTNEYIKR